MPDLAVKRDGVSFAMSFICGLSTIATLSDFEPPEEPAPPELAPTAPITPIAASAAKVHPARDHVRAEVLLMVWTSSCGPDGERGSPPVGTLCRESLLDVQHQAG